MHWITTRNVTWDYDENDKDNLNSSNSFKKSYSVTSHVANVCVWTFYQLYLETVEEKKK